LKRTDWTLALAVFFVAQLVWYLVYTERILDALRANAATFSDIYSQVQGGIVNPDPDAAVESLMGLQDAIIRSGVPFVVTGPMDTVTAAANLPDEVDLASPEGQEWARAYARRLAQIHPPLGDPEYLLIHYGDSPEIRGLRWTRWFQAAGLFLTAFLGWIFVRSQRRAESERAWTSMARELAHQLGTPLSSLEGWLELLRTPASDRPSGLQEGEIAGEIGRDLRRLERISHRFELIGREPELREVRVQDLAGSLRKYLEVRLPRLAAGVALEVNVPDDLPPVLGNEVLLSWALENVVKNSLDALAGKGGTITVTGHSGEKGVLIAVTDDGPGVDPLLREEIFEPGITSKTRGWGVGLALSRRIVEGVHRGKISLADGGGPGATFHIRLPSVTRAAHTARKAARPNTGAGY
jgi:signal transduction histidine kinase